MLRQDFHGWRVTGTGGGWPELIVNPLLSSLGGLSYFKPIWGGWGLIETVGGLFNLETTMISVLHKKKTRIQSGKAQVQEVLGHAAEDQIKSELPVGR